MEKLEQPIPINFDGDPNTITHVFTANLCDFRDKQIRLGIMNMKETKEVIIGRDWLFYNYFLWSKWHWKVMLLGHLQMNQDQMFHFNEMIKANKFQKGLRNFEKSTVKVRVVNKQHVNGMNQYRNNDYSLFQSLDESAKTLP